tara:strand:+ start:532 stop:702 length:171 start_codon:yes stop_codon:yes gene_type:complete
MSSNEDPESFRSPIDHFIIKIELTIAAIASMKGRSQIIADNNPKIIDGLLKASTIK